MSLLKNSSIVMVGVVVSNLLAYAFHFVAGRMLGPDDYGELGALMALFLLIAVPASALGFAITKFTSRFHAENQLGHIALLRRKIQNDVFILSAIVLLLTVILSPFIASYLKISSNTPVILVGVSMVFVFILPVNRGILQGMKKFTVLSWNNILESFSRLVLLYVLLYFGLGVNGAILAYAIAYFIAFLLIFPSIKETRLAETKSETLELKSIYRYIIIVLLVNLMVQLIMNVPSILIKHYYSSEFTGYWTAALNIARISTFVTGAVALVMFPEIAGASDAKVKKQIFGRAAFMVLAASSAMALAFFFLPELAISILYGPAYMGASPILKWLGFAMVFMGMLQLWASYHLARMK